MGGGIGMGNTCKPMAVSFKCMTKSTTNKKKKIQHLKVKKKKKENSTDRLNRTEMTEERVSGLENSSTAII